MDKQRVKLIPITLMMIMSLCLMTVSSYAYLVLSKSPGVNGIAVTVGGSDTIKLAGNVTEVLENGEILHYPGFFSGSLQLNTEEDFKPLKPVSTTDGINWYFPKDIQNKSYSYNPGIIKKDQKSLQDDEFIHDSKMEYANIQINSGENNEGSYLYFDFWAVSPVRDCVLRISTGDDDGSYVINMPAVEKTESSYQLNLENNRSAAYARVGFLVNTDTQTNNSMNKYVTLPQYNEAYKKLKGVYREKGEDGNIISDTTFTIYEPNCDWHPANTVAGIYTNVGVLGSVIRNGDYAITAPLSRIGNIHILGDVEKSVTAQKTTQWLMTENEPLISKRFENFISNLGEKADNYSEEELMQDFYKNQLRGNCANYLSIGQFIPNTSALYTAAEGDLGIQEYVSEEKLNRLGVAGATKDVDIVYLEKNVPQRIRMYIYLEGQDIDCISSNEITNLIFHLELAGGSRK